ncbi:uncharacterized protein KY384_008177 [Bacidia gigantensis]|uniref:uncharacterized protein n=1 Tax=Bacidia gigantensis TaxID=2732470 RepID=UPI001D04B50E|nr:uncharacterized protein KY384_008177 [Bacidia gigantensis]KAG8526748.1 hypothetical protein KY384_008177 [Bacidia gigantensis]
MSTTNISSDANHQLHPLPAPFARTRPQPTLLTQGAEALIYRTNFLQPTLHSILKYRPSKAYRHPTLDRRLTRHRILSEARTLVKCRREGVSVPGVLGLDADGGGGEEGTGAGGWMVLEYIEGKTVREALQLRRVESLMQNIGRSVGRLHEVGVVHGDLTTSNMMLRPTAPTSPMLNDEAMNNTGTHEDEGTMQGEIVLIDFGLAAQSLQDEDKAVDLYVLERAFGSTHPEIEERFQDVLKAYGESYKGAKVVLKRLEDVRLRGRKRSMVG